MTLTLHEFWCLVDAAWDENPNWRYGQAVFNVLYEVRPDLSEQIRANHRLDPFHDDDRVPALREWMEERW